MRSDELHLVETLDDLDEFRRWLSERRSVLAVDIETSGLSLARDRVRLVQFGDEGQGWALPYEDWRGPIRQLLEQYEEALVLHHAKFDASFLARDGVKFPWSRAHDTMLMLHVFDSMGPKGLKAAAKFHVDPSARAGEQELKRLMVKNRWTYETVPVTLPAYWGYGAMDTVLTARLADKLWPQIQQYREAYDLELACERVLCEMEMRGVRVDVEYCAEKASELDEELETIQTRLGDVSATAPRQIAEALLAQGARLTKRTEGGQLSVDDEVLSGLASVYPLAADVVRARHINKIRSTYFDNFLDYNVDGVLHPHINQLAARTGRMSVTEPALQTVPRQSLVRDAFMARDGNSLILCDYDNEELRVAAHFADDAAMLEAFEQGRDLHGETARRIFGEGFTREQRGIAKACMFAKAYGAGLAKFAKASGISEGEAAKVYRTLDTLYPGLSRVMAQTTVKVRERADGGEFGWIQLIDGRRLRVPADKPYTGFNYLVQGSCAVVLKQTLVSLDLVGLGEYVVLPVHDEIVFDVPTAQVEEVRAEAVEVMTRRDFRAPLTVGSKIVDRWGEPYREEKAA